MTAEGAAHEIRRATAGKARRDDGIVSHEPIINQSIITNTIPMSLLLIPRFGKARVVRLRRTAVLSAELLSLRSECGG